MGMHSATRSPGSSPILLKPFATRLASAAISRKVRVRQSPLSSSQIQATRPSSLAQRYRQFCAILRRPPQNHCDHSGPALSSRTRVKGACHSTFISRIISVQKSSGHSRLKRRKSSVVVKPRRVSILHTFVFSMNSRDGSKISGSVLGTIRYQTKTVDGRIPLNWDNRLHSA